MRPQTVRSVTPQFRPFSVFVRKQCNGNALLHPEDHACSINTTMKPLAGNMKTVKEEWPDESRSFADLGTLSFLVCSAANPWLPFSHTQIGILHRVPSTWQLPVVPSV
mmetsp:Transcript_22687/g.43074  ORF Transcript_22687/g.43074 Transcript_22687/m.43074 type:complete len:108 (-) Transcript_22687:1260-1583(-)